MQRIAVKGRDVPAVLRKAFPGYRGRLFRVMAAESVTLHDAYWSGGTRSEYRAVNLITGEVTSAAPAVSNPFRCPHAPSVDIPPGVAVVEHVIFCGKDRGLVFHLHPENMAKLLPSPTAA